MTNHKRGVGKSTSATCIAFGLVNIWRSAGAANLRLLLVDTDSQSHAAPHTTGGKDRRKSVSLYALFTADWMQARRVLAGASSQ